MKTPRTHPAIAALFVVAALAVTVYAGYRFLATGADMITFGLAVVPLVAVIFALTRGRRGVRSAASPAIAGAPDPLTGLPLRDGFKVALADAVDKAKAADRPVGLMLVDLNGLRTVNEIWGHPVGDDILKTVGERLQPYTGRPGALARIDGDTFALIVEQDPTTHALRQIANNIHKALEAPFLPDGSPITLRSNIGAAIFPVNADSAEMLFRAADAALTKAKADRNAALTLFDTEMRRRMQRRTALERDLRHAIERNELVVFYQPQLELSTGRVRGYEALVRWERPGEGILAPEDFLAIAQETGTIHSLGQWVLRRACADAVEWADGGAVAVNFCPAQLQTEEIVGQIAAILAETGLPAERLEIEVPESLFLGHDSDAMDKLMRIKALGVRVAMDDFGSGYSGLASLAHFPFDRIKIDRRFVSQLTEDADVVAIVAAIVGLGRALSVDITAEGVESADQVTLLKAAGCNIVQGYLFGAPQRRGALAEDEPTIAAGAETDAASAGGGSAAVG